MTKIPETPPAALAGAANVIYADQIGFAPGLTQPTRNLRNQVGSGAGSIAVAQGFWSKGDGGGGVFYWDTTTTNRDDGGTYIVPNTNAPNPFPLGNPTLGQAGPGWRRIYSGPISVKWFGAKDNRDVSDLSNPGVDDSRAIQNAVNAVAVIVSKFIDPGDADPDPTHPPIPTQKTYPTLVFPEGNYKISTTIVVPPISVPAPNNPPVPPLVFLRVVGLGNAHLIGDTQLPTNGFVGWRMFKPLQVSFEGLSFFGFATGLELGHAVDSSGSPEMYNAATATVQLVRCNFYWCQVGLMYSSRSSLLTLENCKFKGNTRHIHIARCDLVYLNRCTFYEFLPPDPSDGHTAIEVGTGRLHIYGGYFTPNDIPESTRTQVAWIGIKDTFYNPTNDDQGAHIGLVAHGVRAGEEQGGITFVNFDAEPSNPNASPPRLAITKIIIRDSQVGPGQGNTTRPECVVRLWNVPNHLEITGCHWSLGLPVDWSTSAAVWAELGVDANGNPFPPHTDDRQRPLVYRVEGNCYNPNAALPDPDPNNPPPPELVRTRHYMPKELAGKANLLGGIRRGTATITDNSRQVPVDLALPPGAVIRPQDISVTPASSLEGLPVSKWWVVPSGGDGFDIWLDSAPGSGASVTFAWSVDLGRY